MDNYTQLIELLERTSVTTQVVFQACLRPAHQAYGGRLPAPAAEALHMLSANISMAVTAPLTDAHLYWGEVAKLAVVCGKLASAQSHVQDSTDNRTGSIGVATDEQQS